MRYGEIVYPQEIPPFDSSRSENTRPDWRKMTCAQICAFKKGKPSATPQPEVDEGTAKTPFITENHLREAREAFYQMMANSGWTPEMIEEDRRIMAESANKRTEDGN